MPIKPIIDVQHRGKRVRVLFTLQQRGDRREVRHVNDNPVKVGLFAEEVIRWLGNAMHQEPANNRQQNVAGEKMPAVLRYSKP